MDKQIVNSAQPPATSDFYVRIGALTDTGQVREHNEDNFLVCASLTDNNWFLVETPFVLGEAGSLLAVADGMGGENAGEVASALAMEAVKEYFSTLETTLIVAAEVPKILEKAILNAHRKVVEHARRHPDCAGMGTTILLAWVLNQYAYVSWSGDSRCYLLDDTDELRIVSNDHSIVWELVLDGKLDVDEAENHPESHIITQSLGDNKHPPRPDVVIVPLHPGNKLMLCSDGLNGMLTSEHIRQVLRRKQPLGEVCRQLIEAANQNGGEDNITVVIMEMLGEAITEDETPPERLPDTTLVTGPVNLITPVRGQQNISKTHNTQRRQAYPAPAAPKKYPYGWLLALATALAFTAVLLVWNRPETAAPRLVSDSLGRAAAPHTQAAGNNVAPPPAGSFVLPPDTLQRLARDIRAALTRYQAIRRQLETLQQSASSDPLPTTLELERLVNTLPNAAELQLTQSQTVVEIAVKKEVTKPEELDALRRLLQNLTRELGTVQREIGEAGR